MLRAGGSTNANGPVAGIEKSATVATTRHVGIEEQAQHDRRGGGTQVINTFSEGSYIVAPGHDPLRERVAI